MRCGKPILWSALKNQKSEYEYKLNMKRSGGITKGPELFELNPKKKLKMVEAYKVQLLKKI